MTVAIGCTGGKHRSVAMTEEIAARLRERGATTPTPPTATWGGSDVPDGPGRPRPSVVALGGGHGLAASLSALRRVADDLTAVVTVADNGGSSGRLRERVRRPPARRPADGAGRPLRRRRLGPDLGAGAAAPVRRRRRDARPRGRQPADRRRSGSCSATTSTASTGSAGCSAPAAGCCRWRSRPLDITAEVRGLGPGDPDALTDRPRPGRGGHHRRGSVGRHPLDPADPAGLPRGAWPRSREADWVVLGPGSWFTSVIPHLHGARAARGAGRRPTPASWSCSTWTSRPARPAGFDARRPPRGAPRARPGPAGAHGAGRPARTVRRLDELHGRGGERAARELVVADVAAERRQPSVTILPSLADVRADLSREGH